MNVGLQRSMLRGINIKIGRIYEFRHKCRVKEVYAKKRK